MRVRISAVLSALLMVALGCYFFSVVKNNIQQEEERRFFKEFGCKPESVFVVECVGESLVKLHEDVRQSQLAYTRALDAGNAGVNIRHERYEILNQRELNARDRLQQAEHLADRFGLIYRPPK